MAGSPKNRLIDNFRSRSDRQSLGLGQHLSLLLMRHLCAQGHILLVVENALARIVLLLLAVLVLVPLHQALAPRSINLVPQLAHPLFLFLAPPRLLGR